MRRLLPCLLLAAALLAGCGWFSDGIDWQTRVGSYSYDNAVKDYGEPQACQEYIDGGMSCTWNTGAVFASEKHMVLTFDSYGYFESKDMMR